MMRALRDLPLKRKLTVVTMASAGLALGVACIVLAFLDQRGIREELVDDLSTTARLIGHNTASALAFSDPASATQTLRSLSAQPDVVAGAVYLPDGALFAQYQRDQTAAPLPARAPRPQLTFTEGRVEFVAPIEYAGEFSGSVLLRSDLRALSARLVRSVLLFAGVLFGGGLLAYGVISKLQSFLLDPIVELAKVTSHVAAAGDYSVRATKRGNDEVGRLIDGFNAMLAQIQSRDAALHAAQMELERRVEERTRELAASVALLNATLDSTTDGIVALDRSGALMCCNSRFGAMWRLPADLLAERSAARILPELARQTRDPEAFIRLTQKTNRLASGASFEVIELAHGQVFERFTHPQVIEGRDVGVVVSYRDVTARLQAEAALAATHKQLLEASRQAGMAEVATGVLHNVGNVLNSVNVSATLLHDLARRSKVDRVAKFAGLIKEHEAALGQFFTADPRARQVPGFLDSLASQLLREQADAVQELQSLRKNIEHIKEIVAMQQDYAKVSGIVETVPLADLVEDAMRMHAGSLARHAIAVECDFAARPRVSTQKHKVLQILVNLMHNAKYACRESKRSDKKIVVRIAAQAGRAQVEVIDNGIGIPAENLTRIFSHGFTTKRQGHGFGLHSGALAAKELGGSLRAYSDGPGCGARFVLDLPAHHMPAAA